MSTYWYFECQQHHPVIKSTQPFSGHTGDTYFKEALRKAASRPVERNHNMGDHHYRAAADNFLAYHPTCQLGLVDEHGNHHPLPDPVAAKAWEEAIDHLQNFIDKETYRAAHLDNPYRDDTP